MTATIDIPKTDISKTNGRHITPEGRARLSEVAKERWRNGSLSTAVIQRAIRRKKKKAGAARVDLGNGKPPISREQRDALIEQLIRAHRSLKQIGERVGLTAERVSQIARANGWTKQTVRSSPKPPTRIRVRARRPKPTTNAKPTQKPETLVNPINADTAYTKEDVAVAFLHGTVNEVIRATSRQTGFPESVLARRLSRLLHGG